MGEESALEHHPRLCGAVEEHWNITYLKENKEFAVFVVYLLHGAWLTTRNKKLKKELKLLKQIARSCLRRQENNV
jgi:hypothetical protein